MPLSSMTYKQFKEFFLSALLALPRFLKNPVQGMKDLPDWEWAVLLAMQAALGLVCGLLASFLSRSLLLILTSIFIAPISSVAVSFVLSGFFYYTFLFFFKKDVNFRLIFTHMLFASIPVLICNIIAPIFPIANLIGILAAAYLLYVGFKDNLQLDEKKLKLIMGIIVAIYILSIAAQLIRFHQPDQNLKIRATPESLDILEQELQGD